MTWMLQVGTPQIQNASTQPEARLFKHGWSVRVASFTVSAGDPGTCCSCTGIGDWIWHMFSHLWLWQHQYFVCSSALIAAFLLLEWVTLKLWLLALTKHKQMYFFSFSPITHSIPVFRCWWFILKAIFTPDAGFSCVNGDIFLFVFISELSSADSQRQPWQHTLPVRVSQVTPPTRPFFLSQLLPFRLLSLHCSPIRQSLVLNHLYSELYLDIFLSCGSQSSPLAHFSPDCSNCVEIKAITVCCSGSEGGITVTCDLLYLIRGNWCELDDEN